MKLSIELYKLSEKLGEREAAIAAKKAGFDAIDYSYYWSNEREEVLGDKYREYAENFRKYLDEIDMACNQAHAPFSLAYGCKFDLSDKKYLWLTHSIESAAILGADNIIVHAISTPKDVDFKSFNIDFYKSLVPYCEKFGIHVSVENLFEMDLKRKHWIGKLGSPQELNDMVARINSPWITACVDIGHAALTGYEPNEFIRGVDSHILRALHVQDNDYLDDRHTLPYTGQLDWKAVMKSLKDVGYDGDLTFEIFKYLSNFPEELIPDALKLAASVGKYLIKLYENA